MVNREGKVSMGKGASNRKGEVSLEKGAVKGEGEVYLEKGEGNGEGEVSIGKRAWERQGEATPECRFAVVTLMKSRKSDWDSRTNQKTDRHEGL